MQRNVLVLLALAILMVGGFVLYAKKSQNKPAESITNPQQVQETTTPSALPMEADAKNILLSTQNESGETGVVSLVEKEGKVLVVINVMGTPEDVPQPAHIHSGACPVPGEVVHPLTNVLNGKSETTIETTMDELLKKMPLVVNIHKSTKESSVYVACGDFPKN
ncbi:MAG: hypothetical protein Q7S79_03050 [bacterium]|nr:hypothetical protein [bacterium]